MLFVNSLKSIMRILDISLVDLLKLYRSCEINSALNDYRVTLFKPANDRPNLTLIWLK